VEIPNFTDPVFIAKVIDFIIFVGGIVWLWNGVLAKQLVKHQETQNKLVSDARLHRERAELALAEARKAIEQAKVDAVRMVAVGQAQAAKLIEDERAAALEHARRIVAHAGGELERERYRVRRELLEETVERAHSKARELARHEIDPAKQQILVERMIADLERAHA
jgi:F0F1-type ATP synthase membrane subunit b/b'